ncbi:MAG: enoyl-CoA hydratase/isomerase family protein [Ilumatobacter sp.]|nr:MAG: enoyl-CoA hydratase/isomerase family protein [Ilumatobacter sp.]
MTTPDDRTRLEIAGSGVATITLAHPPLNIYDLQMRDELIEAFAAVRDHPDVRVVVLAADGRHFSAGADLKEFGTADGVMDARSIRWERDPWTPLWELPQPTIVAFHGYALGAGLEMALLCDIRIAADDTTVGLPETTLGMLPSAGGTQSLARVIGPGPAMPVVMLGQRYDAEEAGAIGLVDQVVADADSAARDLAERIARADPAAVRAARRALRVAVDLPLADGLRRERLLAAGLRRDQNDVLDSS